ncbi:MAG: bifunctional phosphopantothenoylcysteine decarboxylase/phosphopantothenate--cysteine ligase CoaBC [Bacteroidota bacterium]
MLSGKKIILGITGSIAAYKAAILTRLLVKEGAEVKVVMTAASQEFITPLTLSTLSKNSVLSQFKNGDTGEWNNHVDLGLWGDAMVIAPASANTMAKMAQGLCDSLLLATYLSARCPVFFAPAMDLDMYRHPATAANIAALQSYGNELIPPGNGELASGLSGVGRMAEPEEIVAFLRNYFGTNQPLKDKKAMVSAGPTYENIDPVRFIGNHSSGKMGFAIALQLAERGAQVTLVAGPSQQHIAHPNITRVNVTSAKQMYDACISHAASQDIVVMAAAVADYSPERVAEEKIKKAGEEMTLKLVKTPDILKQLGENKPKSQLLIGFALETNNELEHAQEKLKNKNLDFIVLNSMRDEGAGFGVDTNKIVILDKNNTRTDFELKSKTAVAVDIVDKIISLL